MTPLSILMARAPCYQDSAQIRALIAIADSQISPTDFGAQRNNAVALLSLHMLALQERGKAAAGGAITSETEGGLSRSYAAPPSGQGFSDWYALTSYGQEFIALRRGSFPSFVNRRFGEIG